VGGEIIDIEASIEFIDLPNKRLAANPRTKIPWHAKIDKALPSG
jgi:hypothetical protein